MNITSLDYQITNAGGVHNFPYNSTANVFRVYTTSAVTLLNNMTFNVTGIPVAGDYYTFLFEGDVTPNGFLLTFMGEGLVLEQGESRFIIQAYYNGTIWRQYFLPDCGPGSTPINGSGILQSSISESSLVGNIGVTKLSNSTRGFMIRAGAGGIKEEFQAKTSGQILIGNGTDVISSPVTGDVTISGAGVTTIGANKVLTTNILAANVTVAKLETTLLTETITIPISFEAGEQCNNRFKMPFAGTVTGAYGVVTKAVANTDSGTITLKNNAGTTSGTGTLTFAASDPLETAYTVSPSSNNTFIAGDILYLTSSKVTAGGKVLVTLTIQRT